jgi:hypothetical protein
MTEQRRNRALTWAWIITPLAFLLNLPLFFMQFPGQQLVPWLALAAFVAVLALCVTSLRRAFGQPQVYRGKISGSIITVIATLLFALTAFGFWSARKMPETTEAPQPGQKAPAFTLADTTGAQVSLASLLNAPLANSPRPDGKPKAVLAIFYRGYW